MGFRIGLIGFGRFGRLAARYLSAVAPVCVFDPAAGAEEIAEAGAEAADLARVGQSDAVILAVPISGLRRVLGEVGPHLKPGSLVLDVCSVKEEPIRWMLETLPPGVDILGTHPLFGPDSAAASLAGRKIVLCPVRIGQGRLAAIKARLAARGLEVIESTAEEHDRQTAVSLALTHFIGRALAEFGAAEKPIDTEGYQRLLAILEVVTHDSGQLFEDMHRFNPHAAEARSGFISAMQAVSAKLSA
jgi:prephenate dehydrogenase